jgi:light-regulated signal transduction histidine kinase (bacteriophytochrome)
VLNDAALIDPTSTARIAGAIAHELNNPLQGILSLVSVLGRECSADSQAQVRLEQIRSGLNRLSRVVQIFSVTYENLPRTPDTTTVERFVHLLESAFSDRQLRPQISVQAPAETKFICMARELAGLIADTFSLPSRVDRTIRIGITETDSSVCLVCERSNSDDGQLESWHGLDDAPTPSGLAVLIHEIVRLGQGSVEFRFDSTALSGMRITLRSEMH